MNILRCFKYSFFMQNAVKNGEKCHILFEKTSKKNEFSTLMSNFGFMILEIIEAIEKIQ